jgi:hypothetical protein
MRYGRDRGRRVAPLSAAATTQRLLRQTLPVRGIKGGALQPIRESMQELPLALVLFLVAWATVARAVLVFTQKLPPTCGACGLRYERRYLGERVCRCG